MTESAAAASRRICYCQKITNEHELNEEHAKKKAPYRWTTRCGSRSRSAAFSPDALTGMEASLRFGGPETVESKIFARLSAWQNWIFQRANAVGERGALRVYGTGQRPEFDRRRA